MKRKPKLFAWPCRGGFVILQDGLNSNRQVPNTDKKDARVQVFTNTTSCNAEHNDARTKPVATIRLHV